METLLGLILVIFGFLWTILLVIIKVFVYFIGFVPIILIRIAEWLSIMPHIWPFPNGFF